MLHVRNMRDGRTYTSFVATSIKKMQVSRFITDI